MSSNRLKLNTDKTQFIVLGSMPQFSNVECDSIRLGGLDIPFLQKITCLGVIMDTEVSMVRHVREENSRCFYQLIQIRADVRILQRCSVRDSRQRCLIQATMQSLGLQVTVEVTVPDLGNGVESGAPGNELGELSEGLGTGVEGETFVNCSTIVAFVYNEQFEESTFLFIINRVDLSILI